jgi:malonyl-CoA O-methyltransferase
MPSSPPSSSSSSGASFSAPIDLRRVRRLFAAPDRVADSDFMRREVALRMHERLALVKIDPAHALDAGCGEGADLPALQQRFPAAHLVGADASLAMLAAARRRDSAARTALDRLLANWLPGKQGASRQGVSLACGDFAQLPFGGNSFDLVWSNLALHWHPQPDRVFAEWRRVLRVNGVLMFSCFGPDTFKQLRAAFASVDADPHLLPFVDMHDFGDMLVNAGFSTPVMDMENITVTYASAEKLLADVRAWGGNPLASRRRGLFGPRSKARVVDALEANRTPDGRLPLTFEVIYGHAFRPVARTTAAGEAIVRFDRPKK